MLKKLNGIQKEQIEMHKPRHIPVVEESMRTFVKFIRSFS